MYLLEVTNYAWFGEDLQRFWQVFGNVSFLALWMQFIIAKKTCLFFVGYGIIMHWCGYCITLLKKAVSNRQNNGTCHCM